MFKFQKNLVIRKFLITAYYGKPYKRTRAEKAKRIGT